MNPNPSWDAIVIGSGIGGLSAAALLAKQGKKVLVLERHYVAGGFTHVFSRKNYEWDVGLHYVGEMGRKNSLLRRLVDYLSAGRLQWAPIPDVYDRVFIKDESFDYQAPRERLVDNLVRAFPKEVAGIQKYFAAVDAVRKATKNFFLAKSLPNWLSRISAPLLQKPFTHWSDQSTFDVISQFTQDPKLIAVLTAQYGDYGLPPRQSSFAIHAIVTQHYFGGGFYPVGGSGAIFQAIEPTIQQAGGEVRVKSEVEEILVENKQAIGVRLSTGESIFARQIISDAGALNTFKRLLKVNDLTSRFLNKISASTEPSWSHLCLYLGVREDFETLAWPASNLWIFSEPDHDAAVARFLADPKAPFPVVYVSFPSAKDPTWKARHPGRCTVEVITFAPYTWFKPWEDTAWKKRGPDYENLKENFTERLLQVLYQYVPPLRGKIDYAELSTPLSTRHFANYPHGEIYGLSHTPTRFRQTWLRPQTPIKNLFLTGQDMSTDGIAGALMGGVLCISAMTHSNILKKIITNV